MRPSSTFPSLLCAALLLAVAPLSADEADRLDYEVARRLMEEGVILPLQRILEKVKGTVLEVELEQERNLYIYEIEVLNPKGIVVELEFDATTGELLESRIED